MFCVCLCVCALCVCACVVCLNIFERFSGTIAASFNGHSHKDELILYHALDDPTEPIGVAWNGGSLTTFSDTNPNYKVYTVDAQNFVSWFFPIWNIFLNESRTIWQISTFSFINWNEQTHATLITITIYLRTIVILGFVPIVTSSDWWTEGLKDKRSKASRNYTSLNSISQMM